MTVRVLGAVELVDDEGALHEVPGRRLQTLLARLVLQPGQVVAADALIDAVWPDALPESPAAALQTQVFRLRQRLRFPGAPAIATSGPGYALELGAASVDALEFERGVRDAMVAEPAIALERLAEALSLWRGTPYAGFEDVEPLRAEQIRLEELHLQAVEAHAEAMLACDEPKRAITELESFVVAHPLRAEAQGTLMRAFAATGRDAEALRVYQTYRHHLAEELGLEPSPGLRRLEASILRGEPAPNPDPAARAGEIASDRVALDGMTRRRLTGDGVDLAWGELGAGSPVVMVPAWISSLEVIAQGGDPRSSLIEHLARHHRVIAYDRRGTGLSGGEVRDFGVGAAARELEAVLEEIGEPAVVFAMSGAGPIALQCAASRPDLVAHLVLFGTYASGPETFGDLGRPILDLLRQRPSLATELLAGLYRPGASNAATRQFASILQRSAPIDVAAGYLEAIYRTDVSDLVDEIQTPALVLHYRGDRVDPVRGRSRARGRAAVRPMGREGRSLAPS